MNIDTIPQELRALRQWVVWRREIRDGKPTKLPYNAETGGLAATNQPSTWTTFEHAYAVSSTYDGVGFVLTGTEFVGIDLDGVVNGAGEAEPFVLEILRLLQQPYTERTPSGHGLRAFVIAPLPPGKRRFTREGYGAEVYSGKEAGRYLTVTGEQVSGNGIPKLENISLAYFLLSQILDAKFKKLWLGGISDYDGDDSRADLALMGILARLLKGDRTNMLAAFSASRLGQREKWGRADYRERTLDAALRGSAPAPATGAAPGDDLLPADLTDSGNARLAVCALAGRGLYCRERKEWFLADVSERWTLDRTGKISSLVQRTMIRHYREVLSSRKSDAAISHAAKSLNYKSLRNCQSIMESEQSIAVLPESLDADPLMLGCRNGILSLLLGELIPPRLDLLVTKFAPVVFDPAAKCDRFHEYLERVQPDPEVRAFLQRLCGSLLTGLQPEQCIAFFYGVGANGKSVLMRILSDILGPDYVFKARKSLLFLSGRHTEHGANDVVDLENKRLVMSTEQAGKKWNWEFIKDYTGGEMQHGRQLYKSAVNFKPSGKILVSANQQPILSEFDEAVRRRFVKVPWDVIIPEKERVSPLDLFVRSILAEGGASGILNWMLAGLCDLIARNWKLAPPKSAVDATETYIRNEDKVRRFLADWFEDGPVALPLTTRELRKCFVVWLGESEKFVMSPKSFTRECQRIFGARCHVGAANWFVVDRLRWSERGRTEYQRQQAEMFPDKDAPVED